MILKLSLGISLLALLACSPVVKLYYGLSPDAIATTYCDETGVVRSVMDMNVIGSDEQAEVEAHEAVHRAQARLRPHDGAHGCPRPYTMVELAVAEVEAYCVSFDVAVARGASPDEVRASYSGRLHRQFGSHFHRLIQQLWSDTCAK